MNVVLSANKKAIDLIMRELPRNSHVMQMGLTTVKEGVFMRVEWISYDSLGSGRPRRSSMLFPLGKIEAMVDGFPRGGRVTSVGGIYGYPYKVVDGTAYAHGHIEKESNPLKMFPIPKRVLDAVPRGYHCYNVQLIGGGVRVMCSNDEGIKVVADVVMEFPTPALKEKMAEAGKGDEWWFGYCAEYEFFMGAVRKSRQWRQLVGFNVGVALPETA